MNCNRTTQAHAYYDNELPCDQRLEFEAHLQECSDCGRLIADFRGLSAMIGRAAVAEIPPGLIERVAHHGRPFEDRIILRIAGWMTATAAGILIAALLSWPAERTEMAAQPAIWEAVAVTPSVAMNDNPNSELLVVAQWMADDLGSMENGELR